MALPMSDAEIASEYRQAKKKQSQIHILAELNNTGTKTIVEILTREGCELPGNFKKKAAPAKEQEAAPEAAPVKDPMIDEIEKAVHTDMMTKARLAALDAIHDLIPEDEDIGTLSFIERVQGIFYLLEMMEAQNGR